jgi:hypothetical protein
VTFDIFTPDDSQTSITDRFGRTFTHTPSRPKRGTYERTAPMSETFTAGEEVTLTPHGRKVRVEFGPFTTPMCQTDMYLVTMLDGNHAGAGTQVRGSHLERGPKFTAGDAVKVPPLDTPGKIAAGPFLGTNDVNNYVVAYPTGTHRWVSESALTKDTASDTYSVRGVTYDLAATYDDNDGDAWTFTGMRGSDGVPLMDSPEAGYGYRNYSLTLVLSSFGPLRKRT